MDGVDIFRTLPSPRTAHPSCHVLPLPCLPSPAAPCDVLIVGAGPVGLTAAAELTRQGARVRIVDKRDGPVIYSQALAVHVRTLEILGALGIADRWQTAGSSA